MDATVILQEFLDETSTAVLAGDWPAYRDRVALPFTLITQSANMVIEDEGDLRKGFDAFHRMLRSQKATDYIRLVQSAQRLDPALISGSYVSHVLAAGKHVVPAFGSQITLRLGGNRWRAVSISNALKNPRWPVQVPVPGEARSGGDGDA